MGFETLFKSVLYSWIRL